MDGDSLAGHEAVDTDVAEPAAVGAVSFSDGAIHGIF